MPASVFRNFRLGRLLYLTWYAPKALVARSVNEGGPWQQWLTARGRDAMKAAAQRLIPFEGASTGFEVCFLTGRRFWYQTAFCCWSLERAMGVRLRPIFIDDGTLTDEIERSANALFPQGSVWREKELNSRLEQFLPEEKYPTLRRHRKHYIHLRKLTDAHLGNPTWRLVMDSDMLFFRQPTAISEWWQQPQRPIHMVDIQDSYGYSREVLEKLSGKTIPSRLNVGILGLDSGKIDWDLIEYYCAALLKNHGSSYYLEQALSALLVADTETTRLDDLDYRVAPDSTEARNPSAVCHHYVALSKKGYFRDAWRHVIMSRANLPVG